MADGNQPAKERTSAVRKGQPIATGVLAYFPKSLALIAEVSRRGNDKHNPGEPLHWAREKSTDEADSAVRHIVDALAEGPLAVDAEGVPHLASAAWRVLAWLERVLDGDERWRTVAGLATIAEDAGQTFESCFEPFSSDLDLVVTDSARRAVSDALDGLCRAAMIDRHAVNVPHSPEFFEQMKTCREAYKRLAMAFAVVLPAGATILDIGCGTGHQSAALARLGFFVDGVDPLADPKDVEQAEGFLFVKEDPIAPLSRRSGYPVVICTEVAEHVYPERADALVDAVTGAARERILWSAARPGQEWEGHVNLQPPEYWIEKFAARGWVVAVGLTSTLRTKMRELQAQHCGAADNFFVFVRSSKRA